MSSKAILTGIVVAAVVSTSSAMPVSDKTVTEKKAQADTISGIIGSMVQTINSPECTTHPNVEINSEAV